MIILVPHFFAYLQLYLRGTVLSTQYTLLYDRRAVVYIGSKQMTEIRWRLRELMAKRDRRGTELAKELNVGAHAVYRLMKQDVMPRIDGVKLGKICRFLDCEISDLLFIEKQGR